MDKENQAIKTSSWKTEGKKKSRAFLEFRPYSAFTFGGRNRKPKAENFRFRPKVSASGIPLYFTIRIIENIGIGCRNKDQTVVHVLITYTDGIISLPQACFMK